MSAHSLEYKFVAFVLLIYRQHTHNKPILHTASGFGQQATGVNNPIRLVISALCVILVLEDILIYIGLTS